jgi:hydroxyacylglutathione hydrolase
MPAVPSPPMTISLPSTMRDELMTNPFLRSSEASIQAAASKFAGKPCRNPVDVFATVRLWKDTTR